MSRLIGVLAQLLAGMRVLVFWPRARLSYLATPRLIGESANLVAGMAICMDFGKKMADCEAGC